MKNSTAQSSDASNIATTSITCLYYLLIHISRRIFYTFTDILKFRLDPLNKKTKFSTTFSYGPGAARHARAVIRASKRRQPSTRGYAFILFWNILTESWVRMY